MATMKVPFLVVKRGAGGMPLYYWQPSKALRACGWRAQRIPDNWASINDPAALETAAIARARSLTAELVAWRSGAPAAAPPSIARPVRAAAATVDPRSFLGVVASYRRSRFFTERARNTRAGYEYLLGRLEAWAAAASPDGVPLPVRAVTPKDVQRLYDALRAKTPALANAVIRMLRIVLEHARRENLVTLNAAANPGLVGLAPSGRVWPKEAIALMVKHADRMDRASIGTAILLNEWFGQREADILALPRSIFARGEVLARQAKTGAGVKLPVAMVPHLVARLAEEVARQDRRFGTPLDAERRPLLLCELTGARWNEHTFRHEFAAVRDAAAAELLAAAGWTRDDKTGAWRHAAYEALARTLKPLERAPYLARMRRAAASFPVDYLVATEDGAAEPFVPLAELQFMHFRHTAIVRLAEAGCAAPLISAISRHTLKSIDAILERYLVRTGAMAREAFQKRIDKEGADG